MNSSKKRWIATLALLVLAFVLWLVWRDRPVELAGARPSETDVPIESFARPPTLEMPPTDSRAELDGDPIAPSTSANVAASAAPSTVRLYGFVRRAVGRDSAETPIGVAATDHFGERVTSSVGDDGAYSFAGLSRARHWVSAGSNVDGWARTSIDLTSAEPETRLDLQLVLRPELLVKVLDETGQPFDIEARATLGPAVATLDPPGEWMDDYVGGWSNPCGVGQFRLRRTSDDDVVPEGFLGRLVLDVEPPVYVSVLNYQRVIATKRVEPGERVVEFVIARDSPLTMKASLVARFVDATTHAPLANANVTVETGASRLARTSEAGVLELESCELGWFDFVVSSGDYERTELRVRIRPGVNDLGEIAVAAGLTIRGIVVDEEGRGIATRIAYAFIDPATHEARRGSTTWGTESKSDGRFEIGRLSRGVYRLATLDRNQVWGTSVSRVDTRNGSIDDLRIRLTHGTPLLVSARDGEWSTVSFTIFDAASSTVLSSRLWSPEPTKYVLAPGLYELEVRAPRVVTPKRIPITIGREPVELALP